VIWLITRLWLGYSWLNAGYQKLWGSEKAVFWNGGGAGVKGFATAGVAGSKAGTGGASYGWFAGFLHGFVIPNASWIAKVVTIGELLIGAALILGPVHRARRHRRPGPEHDLHILRIGRGEPGLRHRRRLPDPGLAQRRLPRTGPARPADDPRSVPPWPPHGHARDVSAGGADARELTHRLAPFTNPERRDANYGQ
jgi:hypothetical protein